MVQHESPPLQILNALLILLLPDAGNPIIPACAGIVGLQGAAEGLNLEDPGKPALTTHEALFRTRSFCSGAE